MSEDENVVIEARSGGRLSIMVEDESGAGHGYRIAGGKFGGREHQLLARAVLDERDVDEIRGYLKRWDQINGKAPAIGSALHAHADEFRAATRAVADGGSGLASPVLASLLAELFTTAADELDRIDADHGGPALLNTSEALWWETPLAMARLVNQQHQATSECAE